MRELSSTIEKVTSKRLSPEHKKGLAEVSIPCTKNKTGQHIDTMRHNTRVSGAVVAGVPVGVGMKREGTYVLDASLAFEEQYTEKGTMPVNVETVCFVQVMMAMLRYKGTKVICRHPYGTT